MEFDLKLMGTNIHFEWDILQLKNELVSALWWANVVLWLVELTKLSIISLLQTDTDIPVINQY